MCPPIRVCMCVCATPAPAGSTLIHHVLISSCLFSSPWPFVCFVPVRESMELLIRQSFFLFFVGERPPTKKGSTTTMGWLERKDDGSSSRRRRRQLIAAPLALHAKKYIYKIRNK